MELEFTDKTLEVRFTTVKQLFTDAYQRSRNLRKLMLDPLDVLIFLVREPDVQDALKAAEINKDDVIRELERIDGEGIKGFRALNFLKDTNNLENWNPKIRSQVLDFSIEEAIRAADQEKSLDIKGSHILAGMIRQGGNTGLEVFRNIGATDRQLRILAKTPNI